MESVVSVTALADIHPLQPFYQGKRILLTGHTGFKGAWLSIWLAQMGAKVTGYSLDPPTEPNLFTLANIANDVESIHADVRNLDALARVVAGGEFDIIFHLAAQALVRESYEQPVETYSTNIMGTVNLLEALRRANPQKPSAVVIVTTDKCYENHDTDRPYHESEPMGGYDPYSSSKGCAELVTSAYRRSFFSDANANIRVASARAGNVIGGGDFSRDRLVPDCLRAFQAHQPVLLRSPRAVRPWQHVLEPLGGYLLLAMRLHQQGRPFAQAWNFGPAAADIQPVGTVAKTLATLWPDDAICELDPADDHPHEANLLMLNCDKARNELGWQSRLSLEDALRWIVQWHSQPLDHARAQCEEQIDAFMEMTP